MKRRMTLQRYIYDQRLPHGSGHEAVTDSKNGKETVCLENTAVRHQTRDKTDATESVEMS